MKKIIKSVFSTILLLGLLLSTNSQAFSQTNQISSLRGDDLARLIQKISGQDVTKLDSEKLPYYSLGNSLDVYISGDFRYKIDSVSGQFVEIMPNDPGKLFVPIGVELDLERLTNKAYDFFELIGIDANLDELTLEIGEKNEVNYFFRWNLGEPGTEEYGKNFIQIGFTKDGQLLNLVNTLPFSNYVKK